MCITKACSIFSLSSKHFGWVGAFEQVSSLKIGSCVFFISSLTPLDQKHISWIQLFFFFVQSFVSLHGTTVFNLNGSHFSHSQHRMPILQTAVCRLRVNPHQTSAQGHSDTPHDHMSFFDAVAAGWMDISRKSWDSGNYTLMKKSLGILSVISASIILVSYPKSPEMLQCGPLLSCFIFLKLYTYTRIYFWAIILL